jgi:hypothetical protein
VLSHVLFNEVNAAIAMCLLFSKARHIMPSALDALVRSGKMLLCRCMSFMYRLELCYCRLGCVPFFCWVRSNFALAVYGTGVF